MKTFLRNNGLVLSVYFVFLLVALFFILSYEKSDIHLYVNQYVGNRYLNAFFYNVDHLGDGWMAFVLVIAVAIVNVRAGIYSACALLLASGLSTVLKYFVFEDANRPAFIFEYYVREQLKFVEGVKVNIHNSFPSGHSTQAFAIFMSVIFLLRRQALKVLVLLVPLCSAFSRVYLSQHWFVDIVAGSVLGLLCSLLFYFVLIHPRRLKKLDKPLTAVFRKTE